MSCSALSFFWYFTFVAVNLGNAVSHRHVDGNGSSFITDTLRMCGYNFFTLAQKLLKGMFVYASFKTASVEMSYFFVNNNNNNPCSVTENVNRFHNH
jgi:hypothetical protein